jgi:hypothetical protein
MHGKEPRDIDVVSFIPAEVIDAQERLFAQFSYPNSAIRFGVDAYIVKVYRENSDMYIRYTGDKLYWLELFSRTKLNRSGRRHPKGFLEINF